MLKDNKHNSKTNQCTFSSLPLVEVYHKLCLLDAPYLWVKCSSLPEELYYIEDIQTLAGVLSGWWNNSGWELPGRCDDIIRLCLVRIRNNKKYVIERDIKFHLTIPKDERTADELLNSADIRIPTPEELLCEPYEDGIPGHIITKEEIECIQKQKAKQAEKEFQTLRLQNEVYADIIKQLTYKMNTIQSRMHALEKGI